MATGGAAMARALRARVTADLDLAAEALRIEAEIELTEVKQRTPVDTGALRDTEHVEGPTVAGGTLTCALVAGGPSAPYALYVHEDTEAFHEVGQAKYLESVVNESAPHMMARVAARMRRLRGA